MIEQGSPESDTHTATGRNRADIPGPELQNIPPPWHRRVGSAVAKVAVRLATRMAEVQQDQAGRFGSLSELNDVAAAVLHLAESYKDTRLKGVAVAQAAFDTPRLTTATLLSVAGLLLNRTPIDLVREAADAASTAPEDEYKDETGRVFSSTWSFIEMCEFAELNLSAMPQWRLSFLGLNHSQVWTGVPSKHAEKLCAAPVRLPPIFKGTGSSKDDAKEEAAYLARKPSVTRFNGLIQTTLNTLEGPITVYYFRDRNSAYMTPAFARAPDEPPLFYPEYSDCWVAAADVARVDRAIRAQFWSDSTGVTIETGHIRRWKGDASAQPTQALQDLRENVAVFDPLRASATRTVLINGLPGAGKSYAARQLAVEQGWRVLCYEASAFLKVIEMSDADPSSRMNGSIRAEDSFGRMSPLSLIELARPDMLVIDDADRIGDVRLLLDILASIQRTSVKWVVLTTNAGTGLDPALVRPGRVDSILEVGGVTSEQLAAIHAVYKDRLGVTVDAEDLARLEGWPIAYVHEVFVQTQGHKSFQRAFAAMAPRGKVAQDFYAKQQSAPAPDAEIMALQNKFDRIGKPKAEVPFPPNLKTALLLEPSKGINKLSRKKAVDNMNLNKAIPVPPGSSGSGSTLSRNGPKNPRGRG